MWKTLEVLFQIDDPSLTENLRKQYLEKKSELFNILTLTKNIEDGQLNREIEENLEKVHKEEAELKLKQEHFKSSLRAAQPQASENYLGEDLSNVPIFFDDSVRIPKKNPTSTSESSESEIQENHEQVQEPTREGGHLIVLCHGIQGSRADMMPIAERIREYKPDALLLLSSANESDHHGELYLMARRLAEEVSDYFKLVNTTIPISSISFVVFSTGSFP